MTDFMKRLAVLFLVLLLVLGAAEHLLMTTAGPSHVAQEASCPIHGGVVQPERAQPLVHVTVQLVRETQDSTHAFDLSAEIPHPPTI